MSWFCRKVTASMQLKTNMIKNTLVSVAVWVVGLMPLAAQPIQDTTLRRTSDSFIGRSWHFASSPLRFTKTDWLISAAVIGVAGGSFFLDDIFRSQTRANQTPTLDAFARVGNTYGEVYPIVLLTGGTYFGGLLLKNRDLQLTGKCLFESALIAGAITTGGKILFGRSRPFLNEGSGTLNPIAFSDARQAFPSGHATLAFVISSVLSERIKNIWATLGLYSLASLTAWSRMHTDRHWFSDTVSGAIIGTSVGVVITRLNEAAYQDEAKTLKLSIHPVIHPLQNGVAVEVRF
jgi:membrane-associated phospholipid phosphatase